MKTTISITRPLALLVFCTVFGLRSASSYAQLLDKQKLTAISDSMLHEGNHCFIVVSLMRDRLLKTGQSFHLTYDNKDLSLDEKVIPEPFQSQYRAEIAEFYRLKPAVLDSTTKGKWDFFSSLSIDGVTEQEVLDPKSRFRLVATFSIPWDSKQVGTLMENLGNDSLTTSDGLNQFEYKTSGIFINGRQLEGSLFRKYRSLFRKLYGYVPSKKSEEYSINFY